MYTKLWVISLWVGRVERTGEALGPTTIRDN